MTIGQDADYRGKPLVLFFYVRDDTPGCSTEAIEFSDRESQFRTSWLHRFSAFRADDCIRHGAFRDKQASPCALLADKGASPARRTMSWYPRSGRRAA